eukprot:2467899-Alexandrium_andersonii.AAC.1
MSASLVGSEMCIRDSCLSLPPPPKAARPFLSPPPRAARQLCPAPSLQWPVSYTHLTLPTICSV